MKQKKRISFLNCFKKLVALSIAFLVAFQSVDIGLAQTAPLSSVLNTAEFKSRILAEHGVLAGAFPIQKPNVIYFQTAHGVWEGAHRLESMVSALGREWGVETVLVEGASAPLDPQLLQFYKNMEKQSAMIEALGQKGWLTAADFIASKHPRMKFLNLEEADYYRESLRQFRLAYEKAPNWVEQHEAAGASLKKRMLQAVTKDTARLIEVRAEAQTDSKNYMAWADFVISLSNEQLNLDLQDPRSQWEYPQLTRLAILRGVEKEFSAESFQNEKQKLELLAHDSYFAWRVLKLIENPKIVRSDWELFFQDVEAQSFEWNDFSHLRNWAASHILKSEIEITLLEKELRTLSEKLLATMSGEAGIFWQKIYQRLADINQLASLRLNREGWMRLKNSALSDQIKQTPAWRFYQLAEAREKVFLNQVQAALRRSNKPVIVISGGFHAEGFEALLRDRKISVLALRPTLTELPDEKMYFDRMLEAAHLEWTPAGLPSRAAAFQGWRRGGELVAVEAAFLDQGGSQSEFRQTNYAVDRGVVRSESRSPRIVWRKILVSFLFGFMMVGMTACSSMSQNKSAQARYAGASYGRDMTVEVVKSEPRQGFFKKIFGKKKAKAANPYVENTIVQAAAVAETAPASDKGSQGDRFEPLPSEEPEMPIRAVVVGANVSSELLFPSVGEVDVVKDQDDSFLVSDLDTRLPNSGEKLVWQSVQLDWFPSSSVSVESPRSNQFLADAGTALQGEELPITIDQETLSRIQADEASEQEVVRALLELGYSESTEAFRFLRGFLIELKDAPFGAAAQELAPSVNSDSYVPFLKKQNEKIVEAALFALSQAADQNSESLSEEERKELALWSMRVAQAFPENSWMLTLAVDLFSGLAKPEDRLAWNVFSSTYFSNPVEGVRFDGSRESVFMMTALMEAVSQADEKVKIGHAGYVASALRKAAQKGDRDRVQMLVALLQRMNPDISISELIKGRGLTLSGEISSWDADVGFFNSLSAQHDLNLLTESLKGIQRPISSIERQMLLARLLDSGDSVAADDLLSGWELFFEKDGFQGIFLTAADAAAVKALSNYAEISRLNPQGWVRAIHLLGEVSKNPIFQQSAVRALLDQARHVRHYEDQMLKNPDLASLRQDLSEIETAFEASLSSASPEVVQEYAERTLREEGNYLPGFLIKRLTDQGSNLSFINFLQRRNPASGEAPLKTQLPDEARQGLLWIPSEANIKNAQLEQAIQSYLASDLSKPISSGANTKIDALKKSVGKVLLPAQEKSFLLMQSDADPAVRMALARYAPEMTWQRLPDLRQALEHLSHDSDPLVRAYSLPALYEAAHPQIAEIFSSALTNPDASELENYFALRGMQASAKPEFFPVIANWIENQEAPSIWQMMFRAHLPVEWSLGRDALKVIHEKHPQDQTVTTALKQKNEQPGWDLKRYFIFNPLHEGKPYPEFSLSKILISFPLAFLAYGLAHFVFGLFGKIFRGKEESAHSHHHGHGHGHGGEPVHDHDEHDHGDGDEGEVQVEPSGKLKGKWWMIIAAVLVQVGGGFMEYHLSFGNALIRGDAWHMWAHVAGFVLPLAGAYKDWFDTGKGEVKSQKARAMANALSGLVIVAIAGIMVVEGVLKFLYFYPVAATTAAMTVILIGALANLIAIPLISKAFPKPLPCPGCGQTHGSGEGGIKIMILHLMQDLADSGAAFAGTLAVSLGFFGVDAFLVMILGYVFGKAGFKATAANLVKWKQIRDEEKHRNREASDAERQRMAIDLMEMKQRLAQLSALSVAVPVVPTPSPIAAPQGELVELDEANLAESSMALPQAMKSNVFAFVPGVASEAIWEDESFASVLANVSESWSGLAALPAPDSKGPDEDFHLRSMADEIAHGDLELARSAVVFDGRLLDDKRIEAWKKFFAGHRYIPIYEIGGTSYFDGTVDHYQKAGEWNDANIRDFLKAFPKDKPKVWMVFKNSALPKSSVVEPAKPTPAASSPRPAFTMVPAERPFDVAGIFGSQIIGGSGHHHRHDHIHGILPFDSDLAKRVGVDQYPAEIQGQVYAAILAHGICPTGYPNKNLTKVNALIRAFLGLHADSLRFDPANPAFKEQWSNFIGAQQVHAVASIPVLILDGGKIAANQEAYRTWLAQGPLPANLVIVQIGAPQIAIQNGYIPLAILQTNRFKVLQTFDPNEIEAFSHTFTVGQAKPEFIWISQLPIPKFHPRRAEVRRPGSTRRNFLGLFGGALLALGLRVESSAAPADETGVQTLRPEEVWSWAENAYTTRLAGFERELERLKKQDGGIELRLTERDYQNNTLQLTPAKIFDLPELVSDSLGYLLNKVFGVEKIGREIQIAMMENLKYQQQDRAQATVQQAFQLAVDIWKIEQEMLLVEKNLLPSLREVEKRLLDKGQAYARNNPRPQLEIEREIFSAKARFETLRSDAVKKQAELGQILNGPASKARVRVQFDSHKLLAAAEKLNREDAASVGAQPEVLAAQALVDATEKAIPRERKQERAALNMSAFFPRLADAQSSRPALLALPPGSTNLSVAMGSAKVQLARAQTYLQSSLEAARKRITGLKDALQASLEALSASRESIQKADRVQAQGNKPAKAFEPAPRADFELSLEDRRAGYDARVQAVGAAAQVLENYFQLESLRVSASRRSELRTVATLPTAQPVAVKIWERILKPFLPQKMLVVDAARAVGQRAGAQQAHEIKKVVFLDGALLKSANLKDVTRLSQPMVIYLDTKIFSTEQVLRVRNLAAKLNHIYILASDEPANVILNALREEQPSDPQARGLKKFLSRFVDWKSFSSDLLAWIAQDQAIFDVSDEWVGRKIVFGKEDLEKIKSLDDRVRIITLLLESPELFKREFGVSKMKAQDFLYLLIRSIVTEMEAQRGFSRAA